MSHVTYHIVRHEDGWAYKVEGTFSETFLSHDAAKAAARHAAGEQRVAGDTTGIVYEDTAGQWREELADGHDRPFTDVED
jgi:hypothetical protein